MTKRLNPDMDSRKKHISKEDLYNLYHTNKLTIPEVAITSGFSVKFIRARLLEYSIPKRCKSEAGKLRFANGEVHPTKKHFFTFTTWDAHLAYVLGVFLGDGSLGRREFVLSAIDRDFVEKFKKECELAFGIPCTPIKKIVKNIPNQNDMYKCSLNSVDVHRWLFDFKGYKHSGVPSIPLEFVNDFIAGLFDSELTVSFTDEAVSRESLTRLKINFGISNSDLCEWIMKYFALAGIHTSKLQSDEPCSRIWKFDIDKSGFYHEWYYSVSG